MATRKRTGTGTGTEVKPLAEYKRKRDFSKTAEPAGKSVGSRSKRAPRGELPVIPRPTRAVSRE